MCLQTFFTLAHILKGRGDSEKEFLENAFIKVFLIKRREKNF